MKLTVLLALILTISACSKGGGGGGGSKGAPAATVTNVTFELMNSSVVPNEDLVLEGTCSASANAAPFKIVVSGIVKDVVCNSGTFEITIPASEIPAGPVTIAAANPAGNVLPNSEITITKNPCNLTQDENAGVCNDRVVSSPEITIPAGTTNISGTDYITSGTVTFDIGNTTDARYAYVFASSSDCADYLSNNCHVDDSVPACSGITPIKEKVLSNGSFAYSIPGIVSEVPATIHAFYENGSQSSSCVSKTVVMDNTAPGFTPTLSRSVTNDLTTAPEVNLPVGGISDNGSGVTSVEVGIGSNNASPNLMAYAAIPTSSATHSPDVSSLTLSASTNYYTFIRATDALGNVNVQVAGPWQYVGCTSFQTLSSGVCVDNAIATPQLAITSGTVLGGDRFTTTTSLTLSQGTTSQAQKLFVFASSADCTTFSTNNCHIDNSIPACSGVTATEVAPSASISYTASHLSHGSQGEISGIYVNGSSKSVCLSQNVELDNLAPQPSFSLARLVTNNAALSPKVNISGGAISDRGNAGVQSVEYAVSTNGTTGNIIPFTTVSTAISELEIDLSGVTIAGSTNYQILIRVTDNLGQALTWTSSNWDFRGCTAQQTLNAGVCVDNPVGTPQILATSTTNIAGNEISTSATVTLSSGTTTPADRLFLFSSSGDCSSHRSQNCHIDGSAAGCVAITKSQVTPSTSISYAVPGLVHGAAGAVISGYYTNGEAQSACISQTVYLDNVGPSYGITLARSVSNDPNATPTLSLSLTDSGLAGIDTIEIAVSSDGVNDDIRGWYQINEASPSITPSVTTPLVAATNYKILARGTDELGNTSTWESSDFTYVPCAGTQFLNSGSCSDSPIASPEIIISNATDILGTSFVNTTSLELLDGTTTNALKLFAFENSSDCTSHRTANCFQNPANPGCSGITSSELNSSAAMEFIHLGLVQNTSRSVYGYYNNGTEISACVSKSVTLDSDIPAFNVANDVNMITSMLNAPVITFNSSALIADDAGGAGIDKIQYAISTNGLTANVLDYQDISTALTSLNPSLSGALIGVGTDYFTLIKAIDKLGNERVVSSTSWRFTTCTATQTTESDGSCTDKPIDTPELIINYATLDSGMYWVTSNTLDLGMGTTTNAGKFFAFPNLSDCNTHRTNSCHVDNSSGLCPATGEEIAPSHSMSYTHPTDLTGASAVIAGYYTNGSEKTACLSETVIRNLPVISGVSATPRIESLKTVQNSVLTVTSNPLTYNSTDLWTKSASVIAVTNSAVSGATVSAMGTSGSTLSYFDRTFEPDISVTLTSGFVEACDTIMNLSSTCTYGGTSLTTSIFSSDINPYLNSLPFTIDVGQGVIATIPYNLHTSTQLTDLNTTGSDFITLSPGKMLGSYFYFSGYDGGVSKLYRTNGTTLEKVSATNGTLGDDGTTVFNVIDNELYFLSKITGDYSKLHKTDGTSIRKIVSISATSDAPQGVVKVGSNIFVAANSSTNNVKKLHKLNGTNLVQISDVRGAAATADWTNFVSTEHAGSLYFAGAVSSPANAIKLHRTNGTTLERVSNVNTGTGNDTIVSMASFNGHLYFGALATSGFRKLFRTSDGINHVQVSNIKGNSAHDYPTNPQLTVHGSHLYFTSYDDTNQTKLFRTDGTTISQVSNVNFGGHDAPANLLSCGGILYLQMAEIGASYQKLWKLENDELVQLTNINPGATDNPNPLACDNGRLYFTARTTAGTTKFFMLESQTIQ